MRNEIADYTVSAVDDAVELSRRAVDVFAAASALIILSPLLLLIAAAIWAESGGPIFYRQMRLGRGGRLFRMYKFRKFHAACHHSGMPLTLQDDDRLTRTGKFLRTTKLDELPQFWNVLIGEMSLVGPRPETPAFADCFSGGSERVLDFKPGIFGPTQYAFRNECRLYSDASDPDALYRREIFPAKAEIDLAYYPTRTMRHDLAWVALCGLAVFGLSERFEGRSLQSVGVNLEALEPEARGKQ